jgi:integrase
MDTAQQIPAVPTRLASLVEDYLSHCRARGLSPRTIDNSYGFALHGVFLPWCVTEGIGELEQLTSRAVDRYTADLLGRTSARGKPLSKYSVHSYIRAVRQLVTWAAREGEVGAAKPQLPKLSKRHREVLGRDDMNAMEAAAPTERDKLIIRILGDCGLRAGELVRLRVEDVLRPENRGQFHVRGKGDRERRVPIPSRVLRRLDRYIGGRGVQSQGDRIFVSLRRTPYGIYEPLTESGVGQLIRDAGRRAGLRLSVHPHLLRHSWMTEMLRQNMNPAQLSVIAGASPQVIQACYEHLTQDDAYESMMKALASRDTRR